MRQFKSEDATPQSHSALVYGLAAQLQVVAIELNTAQEFPVTSMDWERPLWLGYGITLQEGAEPFAINIPRRITIQLMQKVKVEIITLQYILWHQFGFFCNARCEHNSMCIVAMLCM